MDSYNQPSVKIKRISRVKRRGCVYNLSVREDESYVAEGMAVHNCRCRVVSLSEQQAQGLTISVGAAIDYLPDPGFASGSPSLLAAVWPSPIVLSSPSIA